MTVRKLYGTPTLTERAVFWDTIANEEGWRIQFNKALKATKTLKPFRLLDPNRYLWASADTLEELQDALPELVDEFSQKSPLFTGEDVLRALAAAAKVAVAVLAKGTRGSR